MENIIHVSTFYLSFLISSFIYAFMICFIVYFMCGLGRAEQKSPVRTAQWIEAPVEDKQKSPAGRG